MSDLSQRIDALEARIRVIEDTEAVKKLMARYWRSLDDKLWSELPDCFTPDVIADYGQPAWRREGRDALVAFLRGTRHGGDDHAIQTAAEEAVLSVIRRPAVFDPARGNLVSFLRMAAGRDLDNLRTKEARRQRNREDRECVELPDHAGNTPTSDELPSFDHPALAEVLAA